MAQLMFSFSIEFMKQIRYTFSFVSETSDRKLANRCFIITPRIHEAVRIQHWEDEKVQFIQVHLDLLIGIIVVHELNVIIYFIIVLTS